MGTNVGEVVTVRLAEMIHRVEDTRSTERDETMGNTKRKEGREEGRGGWRRQYEGEEDERMINYSGNGK